MAKGRLKFQTSEPEFCVLFLVPHSLEYEINWCMWKVFEIYAYFAVYY